MGYSQEFAVAIYCSYGPSNTTYDSWFRTGKQELSWSCCWVWRCAYVSTHTHARTYTHIHIYIHVPYTFTGTCICWVQVMVCDCLDTWACNQMVAGPGGRAAAAP